MNESATPPDLPPTEAVVRRVESLWRHGRAPDPTDLLGAAGLTAPAQVAAVLTADQWQRWRAGERVRAEDYLARHPAVAADPACALLLVYGEYLVREELGEAPDADDYLRRFPQYADPLRLQFQVHRAVGGGSDRATALFPEAPTALRAGAVPGAEAAPAVAGYELRDRLGQGGMGVVWLARDLRLGRDVALKVMRDQLCGRPALVRRFLEEAQVASQLAHPAIPPVHELGTLPDGRPFFAMKVVKGRTLADLLGARKAPTEEQARFLGVFEHVCQAVAYAHSKGVIHRDLKPDNVMVGAFGEVQLMDWGLAKVLGQSPERELGEPGASVVETVRSCEADDATQAGSVLGTPAYMAPEQARGQVAALDERCDVFGLGAILCQILTGQPPYGGPSEAARRQAERGEVGPALGRLAACGADAELIELARRCLSPAAEGRPPHAGAVAAALTAYLAGVRERLRQSELERAAAQARAAEERKRRRVQLAAAALVLLLLAGGGLLLHRQAADRARRQAEQRQVVESALDRAAGLRQQARWGEARAVLEQARQGLGEAAPDDLRQSLDGAEAELALVNRLDAIRLLRAAWVGDGFDNRTAVREYAAAFREAGLGEVGDDPEAVARRVRASPVAGSLVAALDSWGTLVPDADQRVWLLGVARRAAPDPWGDRFRDPAIWHDQAALRALADEVLRDGALLGQLSPHVLEALGWHLGGGAGAVPLLRAAQRLYPNDFWLNLDLASALRAAKQAEQAVGYDRVAVALRPDAAAAHNNLGVALSDTKDMDGAIAAYRRAIELDPNLAYAHNNLGSALRVRKDLPGAIAACQQAIRLAPRYAGAHSTLGQALYDKQDLDGAIAEYRKAIDCDPKYATPHNNLGLVLRDKQDLAGALAEFRQAILRDPDFATAHINLGLVLYERQDLAGCIAEYRTAVALDLGDAVAHYNLGNALADSEDREGAITEYRQAIALVPDYAKAHCNLGLALRDQGRFVEALEELRRGHELGTRRPDWTSPSAEWVRNCERLIDLDRQLLIALGGGPEPAEAAGRLALARVSQVYKRLYAAAARFYAAAFAGDLRPEHRYDAARSAALAAAGRGEDARHLPDRERLMLRRQALAWLRAELNWQALLWLRTDLVPGGDVKSRDSVRERVAHWRQDADLASVRDPRALAGLPDDEARRWRQLWDDIAGFQKKVEPRK